MEDQTKPTAMTSQPTVIAALHNQLEEANDSLKRWEHKAITDIAIGNPNTSACRLWNKAETRRKAILVALEGRQPTNTQSDGISGVQLQATHQVCNNGDVKPKRPEEKCRITTTIRSSGGGFNRSATNFKMSFTNGWTVSVVSTVFTSRFSDDDETCTEANVAEIAAWDIDRKDYVFSESGGDTVSTGHSPDEVAEFIDKVRNF